jgi:hypothetical protein
MTMIGYMTAELGKTVERWGRALLTLSDRDLELERVNLVRQAEATTGASPAALILREVDAEIARRKNGRDRR